MLVSKKNNIFIIRNDHGILVSFTKRTCCFPQSHVRIHQTVWSFFLAFKSLKSKYSQYFLSHASAVGKYYSGPAVLSCSGIDCENAAEWIALCRDVCWSLALVPWEHAVISWANGQITAKLVNKNWREASKFQGKKIFWNCILSFPCCWQPGGTRRHSSSWSMLAAGGFGLSCRHRGAEVGTLGSQFLAWQSSFSGDLGLPSYSSYVCTRAGHFHTLNCYLRKKKWIKRRRHNKSVTDWSNAGGTCVSINPSNSH